ncbi:MAG: bifunctional phosphopantothenoylcysteine decarboxylase/phosphopantothenate--cysteine ligase CoaBC, partial [Bacteroidales bacterium]|nr:bifunctional phosphopantothenoylcysteine decarboxylase/phosphopantothenate--cysteine ligase CoaBC [Bacteroidales bacterium]
PSLVRLFVRAGAEVRVVCTAHALEFVTPLTLETVSGHGVYTDLFQGGERSTHHIHYADWGDLLLVAPATGNILAKMAHGIADDALTTLYLAFHKPVIVAPAMNVHMYGHPATADNLRILSQRGVRVLDAAYGLLACGCEAQGCMPEPEEILQAAEAFLAETEAGGTVEAAMPSAVGEPSLKGKKVLVTAGPTQEPIDPVRYITNRSSGRMGFCIADALQRQGAEVFLVSGPSVLRPETAVAHWEKVRTAEEMYGVLLRWWPDMDAGIFSAAVADYRVRTVSDIKMKKTKGEATLALVPNPDLLAYAGGHKTERQCVVGFALETDRALANAEEKLRRKNADIMVLNTLEDKGAGFETMTNKVTFLYKDGTSEAGTLESKVSVAE